VAHFNNSWAVRVRRDDLLVLQVDGTRGSAVSGLRECWIQPAAATPRPTWNPDIDNPHSFHDDWLRVPHQREYHNAFKAQWELYLRHIVRDEPFPWDLLEGAKGVQLAEKGYESSDKRCWVDVPALG
jgi:predicted dehydrogenase